MKKFLSFVLSCTVSSFTFSQSPIVLEESDFATGGDSYYIVNANPVITFDGTETGPDYNWDFSDLEVMTATGPILKIQQIRTHYISFYGCRRMLHNKIRLI